MKKIIFFAAAALIAAVSCNKENETPVATGKTVSYVANVDGAATRTAIGATEGNAVSVLWKGAEEISVVGAQNHKFSGTASDAGQTSLVFNHADADCEYNETEVAAVYPYMTGLTWDGTTISGLSLKTDQTLAEGSFDPTAALAVALPDDNNVLNFKNVHSLIKVTIGDDNVTKVCLYTKDGTKIAGDFNVTYNGTEPKVTAAATAANYDFITGDIKKGATYYLPVLPTTVAAGNFVLEYSIHGDNKLDRTKSTEFIIERNTIYDMGEISLINEYFPATPGKVTIYATAIGFVATHLHYWGDGVTGTAWPGMGNIGETFKTGDRTYSKFEIDKTTIANGKFNFLFHDNKGDATQTFDIKDLDVKDVYVFKTWDSHDEGQKWNTFEIYSK